MENVQSVASSALSRCRPLAKRRKDSTRTMVARVVTPSGCEATGGCDIHPLKTVVSLGKLTKNYGKSPFLTGKSTISMVIFNSYGDVYQRVNGCEILVDRW